MWPAPTAEDWAKPVQITWQRTWADAVAVSRETGKPIMVAVNMDGEIASEHYAGIRYRDPEVGKLFDPYVSVIASVYRHNPRDYDENGNRIPCPRFGCVTCGEHIAMEPTVYAMYLDETRVAPRHIGVELDGTEFYDVFYALDVKSVLTGIDEEIKNRESTELPDKGMDRPLEELVASRRQEHRAVVEKQFRQAKRAERLKLLDLSDKLGMGAPIELLRLALFGLDVEVASEARRILSEQRSEAAIDLIAQALEVPMPEEERQLLIGALEAMAPQFARARSLSITLRGLEAAPASKAIADLRTRLRAADPSKAAMSSYEVVARLERASKGPGAGATPMQLAASELARAEATLRLAVDPEAASGSGTRAAERAKYTKIRFQDAKDAALSAEAAGLVSWRSHAVVGLCDYYLGDVPGSKPRLESAFQSMAAGDELEGAETAQGWIGMAVLTLIADERVASIQAASKAKKEWPKAWVQEATTAFDLLAEHPLGNDAHILKYYDFLTSLGARRRAMDVLANGVGRFRGSETLHGRLRQRLLWSRGVGALEESYGRMKARPEADEVTFWYSGVASLVAAEFRRRRSQPEEGFGSYARAMGDFAKVRELDPNYSDSADHYVAIALAGQARIRMEQGKLEEAGTLLRQAFEIRPDAAGALDGLNASAVTTAKLVIAKMGGADSGEPAKALQSALSALPQEQLKTPAFETPPNTPAARNRDRRGRQR